MKMHHAAVEDIDDEQCPDRLLKVARRIWDSAVASGERHGYRNAQVTVLAPTGTIGFMMDCDTTGIEPEMALVRYKQLAGGGSLILVNQSVSRALERLGYSGVQISAIVDYIDDAKTIEGAPHLKEDHLSVFDCAFKPAQGVRCIHYMGHIRMMAGVQPFLSGAISKTINVPHDVTAEQIAQAYMNAWKLGVKAVAIYRDGSKRTQPLNVKAEDKQAKETLTIDLADLEAAIYSPHRHRLPATRPSTTHKFNVANHEGYLTVGMFEDGTPGELFITMAKEGSTVGGLMDAFSTAISLCLQYGVPLEDLVKKFSHQRFEPNGMTSNRDIPFAKSIVDYIFRWLGMEFLADYREANIPNRTGGTAAPKVPDKTAPEAVKDDQPSEPGRADQASGMEVNRPDGAFSSGTRKRARSTGGQITAAAPRTSIERQEEVAVQVSQQFQHFQADAPLCDNCGSLTVRNGNCYKCYNCGASLGCS